jgi:hypothetical protein
MKLNYYVTASKEDMEWELFAKMISKTNKRVNACGIFELDFRSLTTLIGALVTYSIVFYQLTEASIK